MNKNLLFSAFLLLGFFMISCDPNPNPLKPTPTPRSTTLPERVAITIEDNNNWGLGMGYDPLEQLFKGQALTDIEGFEYYGTHGLNFRFFFISSQEDINKKFQLNSSLSGSTDGLGFSLSGDLSHNVVNELEVSEDHLSLIVECTFVDKEIYISSYGYTEEAQILISQGENYFENRYGDHYLTKITTGASFYLVYTAQRRTTLTKDQMAAALNLHLGGLCGNADFHTDLEYESEVSTEDVSISFRSYTQVPTLSIEELRTPDEIYAKGEAFRKAAARMGSSFPISSTFTGYDFADDPEYYEFLRMKGIWLEIKTRLWEVYNTLLEVEDRTGGEQERMEMAVDAYNAITGLLKPLKPGDHVPPYKGEYDDIIYDNRVIVPYAMKEGTSGGSGGSGFDAQLTKKKSSEYNRLTTITVYAGSYVHSMELTWKNNRGEIYSQRVGKPGDGKQSTFTLADDEYINRVYTCTGAWVDKMIFYTNKGRSWKVGGNPLWCDEKNYYFTNRELHGVYGASASYIHRIGFYSYTHDQLGR